MTSNKYYYLKDLTGIDSLTQVEGTVPKPGRGQVLVRIHAVSLNYRDLITAKGTYGGIGVDKLIPLSDGAGEVVELGEGVSGFKKGDRVYGTFFQSFQGGRSPENMPSIALGGGIHGVLTQYQVFDQYGVLKFPEHLSYEEAATLPCAAVTAFNSLFEAQRPLRVGEYALVLGTGGVSIFGLQFAKAAGARVIVTSSSDEKLEIAKKLGADYVINYKKVPDWEKKVLEFTGGKGVDHVLEVGGGNTFQKSLQSTRIGGHIGVIGFVAGGQETGVAMSILQRNLIVRGIYVGSTQTAEAMNRLIEYSKLKPLVDKVFPFEEAVQAYKYLESQKHIGKVVIKV